MWWRPDAQVEFYLLVGKLQSRWLERTGLLEMKERIFEEDFWVGGLCQGERLDDLPPTPSLMREASMVPSTVQMCVFSTAGGHRRLITDVSWLRKLKQPLNTTHPLQKQDSGTQTWNPGRECQSAVILIGLLSKKAASQHKGSFHKPLWGSKTMEGLGGDSENLGMASVKKVSVTWSSRVISRELMKIIITKSSSMSDRWRRYKAIFRQYS